jgi:hypothetical protein
MATTERAKPAEGFQELTREEGWALLEKEAERYLRMSAEEFLRRWDAHEFENPDTPEVLGVAMLIPFAR